MSVDFPEPFSPSSAWISPAAMVRAKSDSASTASKLFRRPLTSSAGRSSRPASAAAARLDSTDLPERLELRDERVDRRVVVSRRDAARLDDQLLRQAAVVGVDAHALEVPEVDVDHLEAADLERAADGGGLGPGVHVGYVRRRASRRGDLDVLQSRGGKLVGEHSRRE